MVQTAGFRRQLEHGIHIFSRERGLAGLSTASILSFLITSIQGYISTIMLHMMDGVLDRARLRKKKRSRTLLRR